MKSQRNKQAAPKPQKKDIVKLLKDSTKEEYDSWFPDKLERIKSQIVSYLSEDDKVKDFCLLVTLLELSSISDRFILKLVTSLGFETELKERAEAGEPEAVRAYSQYYWHDFQKQYADSPDKPAAKYLRFYKKIVKFQVTYDGSAVPHLLDFESVSTEQDWKDAAEVLSFFSIHDDEWRKICQALFNLETDVIEHFLRAFSGIVKFDGYSKKERILLDKMKECMTNATPELKAKIESMEQEFFPEKLEATNKGERGTLDAILAGEPVGGGVDTDRTEKLYSELSSKPFKDIMAFVEKKSHPENAQLIDSVAEMIKMRMQTGKVPKLFQLLALTPGEWPPKSVNSALNGLSGYNSSDLVYLLKICGYNAEYRQAIFAELINTDSRWNDVRNAVQDNISAFFTGDNALAEGRLLARLVDDPRGLTEDGLTSIIQQVGEKTVLTAWTEIRVTESRLKLLRILQTGDDTRICSAMLKSDWVTNNDLSFYLKGIEILSRQARELNRNFSYIVIQDSLPAILSENVRQETAQIAKLIKEEGLLERLLTDLYWIKKLDERRFSLLIRFVTHNFSEEEMANGLSALFRTAAARPERDILISWSQQVTIPANYPRTGLFDAVIYRLIRVFSERGGLYLKDLQELAMDLAKSAGGLHASLFAEKQKYERAESEIYKQIASGLCDTLEELEESIADLGEMEKAEPVIQRMGNLRTALSKLRIDGAVPPDAWGKVVEFDPEIHQLRLTGVQPGEKVQVKTRGVKTSEILRKAIVVREGGE